MVEGCECSRWRRLDVTFPLDFCVFIAVQRLPLYLFSLWSGRCSFPSPSCCSGPKCCRTSFKRLFWLGSSWASCPQQRAPYAFCQDYECLLSTNHSYHKTQINVDRYVFNGFINLKGFSFLLKQASGSPSRALASPGLQNHRVLLALISQHEPFAWHWRWFPMRSGI